MKIIIASARSMIEKPEEGMMLPEYLEETNNILEELRSYDDAELQKIWGCSNKNLESYVSQLRNIKLTTNLSPAVKTYQGVVYKQFNDLLDRSDVMEYLNKHLRIISAFYGVLKANDGVRAYRLEMASPMKIDGKNLYRYWSYKIYDECRSDIIINLASEEYGKCVRDYLNETDYLVDIDFLENKNGKLKRISGQMKKARGEMLRYMIENHIEDIESLKAFSLDGYRFVSDMSSERKLTFIR